MSSYRRLQAVLQVWVEQAKSDQAQCETFAKWMIVLLYCQFVAVTGMLVGAGLHVQRSLAVSSGRAFVNRAAGVSAFGFNPSRKKDLGALPLGVPRTLTAACYSSSPTPAPMFYR